jgi:hypothetical protein
MGLGRALRTWGMYPALLATIFLVGCGDSTPDGATSDASVTASSAANTAGNAASAIAPTISGSPTDTVVAGQSYSFVPTTTNPADGTLGYAISNKPTWATFNTVTGALTGTPSVADVGSYSNITISASNGSASASLAAFSINVTQPAATNSASLSWSPPTQNTNGSALTDLAGYTVYYGTSSTDMTQTIELTNPSLTSYVVSDLPSGTYYFSIVAYSSDGTQSTQSNLGSKTII